MSEKKKKDYREYFIDIETPGRVTIYPSISIGIDPVDRALSNIHKSTVATWSHKGAGSRQMHDFFNFDPIQNHVKIQSETNKAYAKMLLNSSFGAAASQIAYNFEYYSQTFESFKQAQIEAGIERRITQLANQEIDEYNQMMSEYAGKEYTSNTGERSMVANFWESSYPIISISRLNEEYKVSYGDNTDATEKGPSRN